MHPSFQALRSSSAKLLSVGALSCLLSIPALAQGGRPDQIFIAGSTRQETGTVTENGLTSVLIDRDGKEKRLDSGRVERIIWGQASATFREGQTYFQRGDFENAAAKFILAASDDERAVIKAVARKLAGSALLNLGAADPSQFDLALDQFNSFLSDYPDSRDVPKVRAMQARATLLRGRDGDVKEAGAMYRQLFEAGTGASPTAGYDRLGSSQAGLEAIHALTAAGETLGAREIAGVLTNEINTLLAAAEAGSADAAILTALSAETQLSEGFVLLAGKQAKKAETFFKSQLAGSKDKHSALRFGAMLGLGQAHAAQGQNREASIQFASVASLDFTNRDRTAASLLHLAETTITLGDTGAKSQARTRLNVLLKSFGDTPSAPAARKLLVTLE